MSSLFLNPSIDRQEVVQTLANETIIPSDRKTQEASKGIFDMIAAFFTSIFVKLGFMSEKKVVVVPKEAEKKETRKTTSVQKAVLPKSKPVPKREERSAVKKEVIVVKQDKENMVPSNSRSRRRRVNKGLSNALQDRTNTVASKPESPTRPKRKKVDIEKLMIELEGEVRTGKLRANERDINTRFAKQIKKMSTEEQAAFDRKVRIFLAKRHIAKSKTYKRDFLPKAYEMKIINQLGYEKPKIKMEDVETFLDEYFDGLLEYAEKEAPTLLQLQQMIEKETLLIKLQVCGVREEDVEDVAKLIGLVEEYRTTLQDSIKKLYKQVPNLPKTLDKLPVARKALLKDFSVELDRKVERAVVMLVERNCEKMAEQVGTKGFSKYLAELKKVEFSTERMNQFYKYASSTKSLDYIIEYYEKYAPYIRKEMAVSTLESNESLHKGLCFAYAKRVSMGLQKMNGKISLSKLQADQILPEDRVVQARQILIKDDSQYYLSGKTLTENGFKKESMIHRVNSDYAKKLRTQELAPEEMEEMHKQIVTGVFKKIVMSVDETNNGIFDVALYMPGVGHQVSIIYDPENQTYGYIDSELGLVLRKIQDEQEGMLWLAGLMKDTLGVFWSTVYMAEIYIRE